MQAVLDICLEGYNQGRPRQGGGMNGRIPAVAFIEGLPSPPQQKQDNRAEGRTAKQAA
ncbi:hypothetical protein [Propylenella binzhouense]|uniref:hypothetical protein n=1 Tax=Propylenella binzhouense TaxID=2555902 RepID=UPI00136880A9|nr:hypothetical protein [Propylenella binzhouense]